MTWSSFYDELNTESENPQISWKYILNTILETNPIVQVHHSSIYTLLAGHPVYDYSFISGKHNLSIAMSTDSHLHHIFCFHLQPPTLWFFSCKLITSSHVPVLYCSWITAPVLCCSHCTPWISYIEAHSSKMNRWQRACCSLAPGLGRVLFCHLRFHQHRASHSLVCFSPPTWNFVLSVKINPSAFCSRAKG